LPEQVRRFATAAHLFFLEMTAEIQEDPIPVFVRKPGLFPALNKALPRSRLQRFRGSFFCCGATPSEAQNSAPQNADGTRSGSQKSEKDVDRLPGWVSIPDR